MLSDIVRAAWSARPVGPRGRCPGLEPVARPAVVATAALAVVMAAATAVAVTPADQSISG